MDARVSVTRLMADARQRLLAALMDVEQRWKFLTPEDRVDALTDLIALAISYIRAFSDAVTPTDVLAQAVAKGLSDLAPVTDLIARVTEKQTSDTLAAIDAFSRTVVYDRSLEDATGADDIFDRLLAVIREYADTVDLSDATSKAPLKVFEDLSGPYVEAGYFADDYWQSAGPVVYDATLLAPSKQVLELASLTDFLTLVAAYIRNYADSVPLTDALSLEHQIPRTETLSATDTPTKVLSPAYGESLSVADSATLDFTTQIQELVASAENFARSVDFTRSVTETASATDAPAKTFAAAFFEFGAPYAAAGYFADDYVAPPTGPAVHDTFTYTLT